MWFLKPLGFLLLKIPVQFVGLFAVALGLLFKRTFPETTKPFTQFTERGNWTLVRLPSFLLPFDNIYDGFQGDKRGWWSNENDGKHESFKAMWLWGAVRNPANYFGRNMIGLDISKCRIVKLGGNCEHPTEEPGMKEWVHYRAFHENGKTYDRFFMSWGLPWDQYHGIMVDVGWKIKMAHNGMSPDADDKDKIRGSVFNLSPWKKLT